MKYLTRGNHKLPNHTAIFDLPEIKTCPGATKECLSYCYAKKATKVYKAVAPKREWNFQASMKDNFVSEICNEIQRMRGLVDVRLHSAGDFYNQAYVNKWTDIVKAFPKIRFTFYTKSFHLYDFSKLRKCKNVTAFASIDPTTPATRLPYAKGWKKATVIKKGDDNPKGYFVCPGSCKTCNHCYKGNTSNVAFHQH